MAGLPEDLLPLDDTPPGWEEWAGGLDTTAPIPEPVVAPPPQAVEPVLPPEPVADPAVAEAVPVAQPLPDLGLDAISGADPQDPPGWNEFIAGGEQAVDATVDPFSLERPFEGQFDTEEEPTGTPDWATDDTDGAEVQIRQLGFEGMAPDERASAFAEDAEVRRQQAAKREAEELAKAAQDERDTFDAFQTATSKTIRDREMLRTRLDELSKRDPDTFFSAPMTGRKAFGWIRAILTGLVSPLHGLAALKSSMDDDLQLQEQGIKREMLGLEKQDSLLGEELALQGDLYKAKRHVQIAWLQKLPAMLEAEAAKFDPAGSKAIAGFSAAQKARSDADAAMAEWEKENFDREFKLEEARLKEKAHLREIAKLEEDIRHAKRQESLQAYGISSENKRAKQGLDADMLEKGFVADPKAPGGYRYDEAMAEKLRGPQKPQDVKAGIEVEQAQRGDVIKDATGAVIGKPVESGKSFETRMRVQAHAAFRASMVRLRDQIKETGGEYKGVGSARWKSSDRAAIETLRNDAAVALAKLRDPVGAISDKAIAAAKDDIPDIEGWTSKTQPETVYQTKVKTEDDNLETFLRANVDGYVPESALKSFRAQDAVVGAKEQEADSVDEMVAEVLAPPADEEIATPESKESFIKARKQALHRLFERGDLTDQRVLEIRSAQPDPELVKEWDRIQTSDEAKEQRRKRRRERDARELVEGVQD